MALQKTLPVGDGYSASYWRIDQLHANWGEELAYFRLKGYKNESVRNADVYNDADMREYNISGATFRKYFSPPDPADVPAYDSTLSYVSGDLVTYDTEMYKATQDIAAGAGTPPNNSAWELHAVLRVEDRKIAYGYIKDNDPDFSDAVRV